MRLKLLIRTILPGLLTLTGLTSVAAGLNNMVIDKTDGTKLEIFLSEELNTYVADSELCMLSPSYNIRLPLGEVSGWQYGYNMDASIEGVVPDKTGMSVENDGSRLTISNLTPRRRVVLCDAGGRVIRAAVSDADGSAALSISGLTGGVYIVSVDNGESLKILVRR